MEKHGQVRWEEPKPNLLRSKAIAAWRNMARSDGKSPSQIFFGRRQKHALPLMLDLMKPDTTDNKNREQRYKDEIRYQNMHTKDYPQLEIGQQVLIQHHSSGEWYKQATITQVRADAKSYWLIDSEGRKYLRGRRLINFGRNWKVSKLESVRIGKCQNRKVSKSESVRIGKCQNWKVSELESVRIGKCQNWKVSEFSDSLNIRQMMLTQPL